MMIQDKELLKDFMIEMQQIEKELKISVQQIINSKLEDSSAFEKFGQVIDRVYGTAATMGLMQLADYTRTMKEVGYMASQSENKKGREKSTRMFLKCLELFNKICESIYSPEEIEKINLLLNQEKGRAEILNRKEFFSVQRKSTDFE